MNIERNESQGDARVSDAYKALANERAPEALNRRILEMARADNAPERASGKFFRRWSKPLGLAASIALSAAIVLEISQPQITPQAQSAPEDASIAEFDALPLEQNDLERREAELPDRSSDNASAVSSEQQRSFREEFAPQTQPAIENARQRARLQAGPDLDKAVTAGRTDESASEVSVTREESATQGSRSNFAPAAALGEAEGVAAPMLEAKRAMSSEDQLADQSQGLENAACDEESRASRATWSTCIDELRKSGDTLAADLESELLLSAFPPPD